MTAKSKQKSKKKKPAAKADKSTAVVSAPPPPPPRVMTDDEVLAEIDLDDLHESFTVVFWNEFGYGTHTQQIAVEVAQLRAKLAVKEAELLHIIRPLVELKKQLSPEAIEARSRTQHFDDPLKAILGHIRLKTTKRYGYGPEESTGAKPWSELQKKGAADAQIEKNIKSINHVREGDYCIDFGEMKLVACPGESNAEAPIVEGKGKLVAEVRRVMNIPAPAKSSSPKKAAAKKSGRKKPAAKKSPKRPAVRSKSSTTKKSNKKPAGKTSSKSAPRSTDVKQKPAVEQPAAALSGAEIESRCLDRVWDALKASGGGDWYAVSDKLTHTGPLAVPVDGCLKKLRRLGRATCTDRGMYKAIEQEATEVAEKKQPSAGPPLAPVQTSLLDPLAVLRELGSATTREIADRLGKTVDATGAQLRRLLKSSKVELISGQWWPAEKPVDPQAKAADSALNGEFEQSLRDRGQKRKAAVESSVANGWAKPEDVPDEDTAAAESLKNDEAWHEPSGGVVVDRRTKPAKAAAIGKPR